MLNLKIKTSGMHCSGCERNAQDTLAEVKGIKKIKADFKKGVIEVQYDEKIADIGEIKAAIVKAGYRPE